MPSSKDALTLRVKDALKRDAARGIARLDIDLMKKLGVSTGDLISLKGKRRTVAKVMPGYTEDEEAVIIRVDGSTRGNAGVGIDDKVEVSKIEGKDASNVLLAPVEPIQLGGAEEYLGKVLEAFPVMEGDRIRFNFLGTIIEFVVAKVRPRAEAVVITPLTKVEVSEKTADVVKKAPRITYEDIGGLGDQIQRVREMMELPLRYPQLFEKLGVEPPKGILLHGPPGTGKTLIAKAVANETDAHFITLNGPEIMSKYYGESEARLREIFEEASKHAPSIIFIDELDAIAPKREEVTGEVERRIVAQLLGLMDGLQARGQVVVIGATNRPSALDPALRRPGRFDREIEIGIPDRNGRLETLQIHTRGMPLTKDVKLEKIADVTHGFVGADLQALCKEGAMRAVRKVLPEIDLESEAIPPKVIEELKVSMNDLVDALKDVEPSAMREVLVESPNVKWSNIGDMEEVKQQLMESIEWPIKYPEVFEYAKTKPPKGILLYGPPGTGKTLLAKAIASESEANFLSIKGPELLSKWVGESEKGVRETFRKAKQAAPSIIFFDEIDAITPQRGGGFGDSHVTERVISQILTELDGLEELRNVVVLAATNRPDIIDPALLRPGRFDRLIGISSPNKEARKEIFKIHLEGKPLTSDVKLETLAEKTENYVGADIEAICREASMLAIREYVNETKKKKKKPDFEIAMKHFEDAFNKVKAIGKSRLQQYDDWSKNFEE
ncbi:AAA family ATPase, partial [Candidatus Bathyarchaeota archaeon]